MTSLKDSRLTRQLEINEFRISVESTLKKSKLKYDEKTVDDLVKENFKTKTKDKD